MVEKAGSVTTSLAITVAHKEGAGALEGMRTLGESDHHVCRDFLISNREMVDQIQKKKSEKKKRSWDSWP